MTKKHFIAAAVIAGATTLGVAGLASAAEIAKPASLASELAQKFNLKEADVQGVIDQHHDKMHDYRHSKYEERLNQAVTDGKLTSAQRDAIVAKHKEMMTFKESLKDKTPEERRSAMEQKHTELRQWQKDNNIPAGYFGGMKMHGGKGPGMGHGLMHGTERAAEPGDDSAK